MTDDKLKAIMRPRSAYQRRAWFCVASLILVLGVVGTLSYLNYRKVLRERHATDRVQAQRALTMKPVAPPVKPEIARQWAALQQERGFTWERLWSVIEATSGPDIELLSFEPEKRSGRLVLRGEARDGAALSAYLSALEGQPFLSNVHLRHQQTLQRERLKTLEFEIQAGFTPAR